MGVDFKLKRTVVLTILVLAQAIMVGLDFHVFIVSIISIVLYLIVTKNDLISVGRIIGKRLKSMK